VIAEGPACAQTGGFPSLSSLSGIFTGQAAPTPAAPTAPIVESAPVQMGNHTLFYVYGIGPDTAQDRASSASMVLNVTLENWKGSSSPSVVVGPLNDQTVILLEKKQLLTVTDVDAANYHEPPDMIATSWRSDIETEFDAELQLRRPGDMRKALIAAGLTVLAGALLTVLVWIITRRFWEHPGWAAPVLIWLCVFLHVLYVFPQTQNVAITLRTGVLRPPLIVLVVVLVCAMLARLWAGILRRIFPAIPRDLPSSARTERTFQRRATIGAVIRVTGVTAIWLIGFLVTLTWLGVNLASLLTSAGLISVAVGLAAQDSMKDFFAGLNILADDRYGVGDSIETGAYQGTVERITLRITQIRDMSGRLITIPNRNILDVANATSRWARVDFKIGVSYYDDLAHAIEVLSETAAKLAKEKPEQILEPPQMLGVDSYTDNNIVIRMILKTAPGDQWAVARDMRLRAKIAFDTAGIAILNALHANDPARITATAACPPGSHDAPPAPSANGQEVRPADEHSNGAGATSAAATEEPKAPAEPEKS
jgi:small conductance mechanosensitive channel